MARGEGRVGIYARVSTLDRGQDPETQLGPLREYAKHREFEIVDEYIDFGSGRRTDRENYQRLLDDARKRKLDVILIWRYDRFARSTQELVNAYKEFQKLGIDFISYQENVDTTSPQGELVFTIMAALAQFESSLISERVRAGMDRAKKQGKHVGRPGLSKKDKREILAAWQEHQSLKKTSRELGRPYSTVKKAVDEFKAK